MNVEQLVNSIKAPQWEQADEHFLNQKTMSASRLVVRQKLRILLHMRHEFQFHLEVTVDTQGLMPVRSFYV